MPPTVFRFAALALLTFVLSAAFGAQNVTSDLTAHEWGTFTSIAGRDGQAMKWLPQNGSTDLPDFVEHLREANFKGSLSGTVRMETPVLYFYSPRETALSVKVSFAKGLITEWYPHASHVEPSEVRAGDVLYQRPGRGSIAWDSVTVSPNIAEHLPFGAPPLAPPRDPNADAMGKGRRSPYYAARETSSAPLLVKTAGGVEQEKFLFYRGVSTFSPPVSATVAPNGAIHITNLGHTYMGQTSMTNLPLDEIPSVILFERRGDKLGYRLGGALSGETPGEMSLDPPELTATFESLSRDLEDILTAQGLYPDEARAMIATWRDSWFEEGSRLFYIVPTHFVHAILPLSINPAPSQTVRVFVGRLELITPATTQAVEKILATHDLVALQKYDRFLEPILDQMKAATPARAAQLEKDLEQTFSSSMPQRQPPK
jgi:hypothetical protein